MSDKVRNFFNRCEHPRIIKNKYTGEPVYVECGVCPHCLISRSDAKRNLCDYEKWNRKYCYFVTLTYNSQYVPKMALVPIEDYEFDYPIRMNRRNPLQVAYRHDRASNSEIQLVEYFWRLRPSQRKIRYGNAGGMS
jgi:hypothetical protein